MQVNKNILYNLFLLAQFLGIFKTALKNKGIVKKYSANVWVDMML